MLKVRGYDIEECSSDADAIEKAAEWTGEKPYPVHFSKSDTSGEKGYEEFFSESEAVDMERFKSLGVITGKTLPGRSRVLKLIDSLDQAFERDDCNKADIVKMV